MIDESVRKRLANEIAAQGREMKEVSLSAGLGETYVRDVIKRGRGKFENLVFVAKQLGYGPEWLMIDDSDSDITVGAARRGEYVIGEVKSKKNSNAKLHIEEQLGRSSERQLGLSGRPDFLTRAEPPVYGPPLPVLGAGRAGEDGKLIYNGNPIEWIPRPPSLEGVEDAYATYVAGMSMKPRFKEGEKVWVHPRRMPKSGDDVVVQLVPEHDGDAPEGFIKEFRRYKKDRLVLYQHNPEGEFELLRDEVKSVHVIVGSLFM